MGFRTSVNVTVQAVPRLTAKEFLALSRLQLKQLTSGGAPEVDQPAAYPAGGQLLQWTMPMGPLLLRVRQRIVVHGGRAFVLTATAPAATFATSEQDFQAVFDSFTLPTASPSGA